MKSAQAAHLRIPVGTACFEVVAASFADGERLLWHKMMLHWADLTEFCNRIGGITAAHLAMDRVTG